MRLAVVGLGVQGRRRRAVAGEDVVATVDPIAVGADYRAIEDVPTDAYDAAVVSTSDQAKYPILRFLLERGKHVLVEKPLLEANDNRLDDLEALAAGSGAVCYTGYNHRFEPHVARLKTLLVEGKLGRIYHGRLLYGNGTAADVRRSAWRDQGLGVLSDLGSHLTDLALYLFPDAELRFGPRRLSRFENQAFDRVLFANVGEPALEFEASLLSWRNTFAIELVGELGSAHLHGLCKWGPSSLTIRMRIFPSGVPTEETTTVVGPDPTWVAEYAHFRQLCATGHCDLSRDRKVGALLRQALDEGPG